MKAKMLDFEHRKNMQGCNLIALIALCVVTTNIDLPVHAKETHTVSTIYASVQKTDTHLYKFKVEEWKPYIAGRIRSFTLFIPQKDSSLPSPPFPVAVLIHGFFRSGDQQRNNAEYLAERGFIVITPNMSRFLMGDINRMHNVEAVVDHIAWLGKQNTTPGSSLEGLVDPNRVAIAGHSSGGSICVEALYEAQKRNVPIHIFCSLDAVPWSRSRDHMAQIKPVDILSLRSNRALCNEYGIVLSYLNRLNFPFEDVLIKGSKHCDGENPTNMGCICICGKSHDSNSYRRMYQLLMYTYFRDVLKAPSITSPTKSFAEIVQELQREGKVTDKLYVPTN